MEVVPTLKYYFTYKAILYVLKTTNWNNLESFICIYVILLEIKPFDVCTNLFNHHRTWHLLRTFCHWSKTFRQKESIQWEEDILAHPAGSSNWSNVKIATSSTSVWPHMSWGKDSMATSVISGVEQLDLEANLRNIIKKWISLT